MDIVARFREAPGGKACDHLTGQIVATVPVQDLDTETAGRAIHAIVAGLHKEFGPMSASQVVKPSKK